MTSWSDKAIFYHIYPLGLCGAPPGNNFDSPVNHRLNLLLPWVDHIANLGINAVYLGPLFESTMHGYDTADFFEVDRRLGNRESLQSLLASFREKGIRVIFDAVFNHVGRDFWAFKDILKNGHASKYCNWFEGLSFGRKSPYGDPFTYQSWQGHYNLVKLNLDNPEVKEHLFAAVAMWINELGIDGLRLDAADCISNDFFRELAIFCRKIKADFWLVGEIIHGDYRNWANNEMLDSVTNYECYKGMYSSFNDKNFFEIAYSLNRLFGREGIYRHLNLYSFVDNHDVDRIASTLRNKSHLPLIYTLLFTVPGIPSIYYGSEWGIEGSKNHSGDYPLRPFIDLQSFSGETEGHEVIGKIKQLSRLRKNNDALSSGDYSQLYVASEQFVFTRQSVKDLIIVIVNSAEAAASIEFNLKTDIIGSRFFDLLDPEYSFPVTGEKIRITNMPANTARILQFA